MPHLHGIERIFDRRKILTRHFVHMPKLFNIFGLSIHTELTVTIVRRFTIYPCASRESNRLLLT